MSLYVLDTDIVSLYQRGHPQVLNHINAHSRSEVAITVITVEEQLTGWYAQLRNTKKRDRLAAIYERLASTVHFLGRLPILLLTEEGILRYDQLQALKVNIGKMDLRIAAITMENQAILVSRNLRDFQRVPGLVVEDWTI